MVEKTNKKNEGISKGTVIAAAGIAVGTAAAAYLSKKDNRRKVMKTVGKVAEITKKSAPYLMSIKDKKHDAAMSETKKTKT